MTEMTLAVATAKAATGVIRRACALGPAILAVSLIAACEPTTPPSGAGTAPPSANVASGPPAGTSTITIIGNVVQIVGAGLGTTEEFELAAGNAEMTVSTCASNQVIPFVTLYDAKDNKLGIIVDAVYQFRNLAGGGYYLEVASNPDCVWTITLTPN